MGFGKQGTHGDDYDGDLVTSAPKGHGTSSNVLIYVVAGLLFVVTVASLIVMILCLKRCRQAKAKLLASQQAASKKTAAPTVLGAPKRSVPPKPAPKKPPTVKSVGSKSSKGPKQAKGSLRPPASKPTTPSTTTSTTTARKPQAMQPAPKDHKLAQQMPFKTEGTQSSQLESIPENKELDASLFRRAYVSFGDDRWREANTAETEEFSFEIESGNTFSILN